MIAGCPSCPVVMMGGVHSTYWFYTPPRPSAFPACLLSNPCPPPLAWPWRRPLPARRAAAPPLGLTRLLVCVVRHHRHAQPIERLPRLPKHEAHIPPQLADGRDRHGGRQHRRAQAPKPKQRQRLGCVVPTTLACRIFVSTRDRGSRLCFGAGVKQPRAASLRAQDGRLRRGWGWGEDQDRALRPPRPPPLPPRPPPARNHALFPFPVLPSGAGNPPPNAHQT